MSVLEQKRREVRKRLIDGNEFPNIPKSWGVERLRFLFTESKERNGKSPVGEMLSVSEYRGVVPRDYEDEDQKRTDEELEKYRVVRPGQLAVNSMWLNHLGLGVSEHTGYVSPAYNVYKISERLDRRFVHHLMRSNYYLKIYLRYLYGIRPNSFQIKSNDWASIPIIVPDLATQRQIADFLDRETARIDLLIEKKQRLVALLGEKLEAHLEEALFGESTKIVPLRRALVAIEQGWSPDCEARNKEGNEWGVLKVGCVNGWKFSSSEHKALPKNLVPRPELEIHEGDLLMSRANTSDLVGSAAIVSDAPRKLMLCDKLYRLKVDTRLLLPSFSLLVLRSKAARRHYSSRSNGASASMQNISQETVRTLPIPTPPLDRQAELAVVFESRKAKVAHTVTGVNCSIERLKEYRSALITAAVTGQMDVQAYARSRTNDRRLDEIQEEMSA